MITKGMNVYHKPYKIYGKVIEILGEDVQVMWEGGKVLEWVKKSDLEPAVK